MLVVPGTIVVSIALWGFYALLGSETPSGLVLALHVLLCLGLAFMSTPLFTSSMAALNPRLYSYGSATISTVQQLAGAARHRALRGALHDRVDQRGRRLQRCRC